MLQHQALVLLAALSARGASAFECAAEALEPSGAGFAPVPGRGGECLPALFGPHIPFNVDFDHALVRASPADGCSELSGAALGGSVALFVLSPSCSAVDAALRAQARGAVAAVFATRSEQPFWRSTAGWLSVAPSLSIPVLLVDHEFDRSALTGASHLRLRLAAHVLQDGVALTLQLAAERDAFFTYALPAAADLTVVVFASAGDPDLYGNTASTFEAVPLPPGTFTAQFQAAHPGDDMVQLTDATAGAYVWCVNAFSQPANFTIQLASGSAELELASGQPMRISVPRAEARYLKHRFALGAGGAHPALRFALTAYTGIVELWVCREFRASPEGDSACAWTTTGRSAPVIDIGPGQRDLLRNCGEGCTYHLIVRAQSAASASVALSTDGGAVVLVDGSPQVGSVGPSRHTSKYSLRTSDGSLDVVATPTRGKLELTVREARGGGRAYTLAAAQEGGSVLHRQFTAVELCANCEVEIEALALRGGGVDFEECVYSLAASTAQGIVTLEDGIPWREQVGAGEYEYFRVYVQDAATDLRLILTPISGNPDLFVSHTHARPNATHHTWNGTTATGNDVVSIAHTDAAMAECARTTGGCIVYASVHGRTASTFTLSALLSVANDGLSITKPAAEARDLVFSNANFGVPLPFVGSPRPLVAVTPVDGCSPISSSLAGKLALIDRGGCIFMQKVFNAQAKGAVGVLVANNADGPPERMGMPANPFEEEVLIPAVMISKADGAALRTLLRSSSAVELVMQQPGDRPLQLLDGVPQESHVEEAQMLFFTFHLNDDVDQFTISVTPEVGDSDLYVSNDGLPPTQTHFGWRSRMYGEDAVTISRPDQGFCHGCTYHVGVYGYTAASFSVLASTRDAAVLLQLGMPLTEHLSADQWSYFTVQVEDASKALRITVTPLTGDPDLYVSTTGRPTRADHQWAATSWGADTLVIQPIAPGFRAGTFFVGVTAFSNTTYTLTASLVGEKQVVSVLVAGRPQFVSLSEGEWQYFRFAVGPNATRVKLNASPIFGDPDLYVTTDGSLPSAENSAFASDSLGVELVEATPSLAGFCADCVYTIGLTGWTPTNMTLSATVEYGNSADSTTVHVLADGMPTEGLVQMGEIEYYRFFIDRTDMAVNVTVTAYSGDPDIYASFTQERPTVADHTFSSTAFGGDSLSISHFDERFCAAASCSLHIGVLGASESRFSVVASQREETRLVLLDGMPQHAALGGGEWQYYTFTLSGGATSTRFAITPSFGDPDLYLSTDREPTREEHTWASSNVGADVLLVTRDDPLWTPPPVTYRLGVYAWSSSNYTIVASSGSTQTLLEDGVPNRGSVRAGEYEYYKVYVDDNATDLELIVTPLSGDPDVFASHVVARPNASHHEFAANAFGRDVLTVEHSSVALRTCTAGERRCVFYVSVFGADEEVSDFHIVASLHVTNRGMRVTQPARLARLYVNRAALFGPPLPFDGEALPVVAAQPADACAPLVNAGALRGHIALVVRGACYFEEKVRYAQAAGARAVIVGNSNASESLVFMAAHTVGGAINVTIPAVLIGALDSDALFGAVSVEALLEQHGDRPRRLVDGLPQFGRAVLFEMVYYKLTVGDAHRDLTFTVTPTVGAVDLFVRRADDGLPPTQSAYDRSSTLTGSLPDTVTIRAGDAEWCSHCDFIVGVLGWSPTDFTIVAASSASIVALQDGQPHLSHLEEGLDFYRVLVTNPGSKLRLLLTPLAGDPDLYVSRVTQRPDERNHTWASTSFGADSLTIWHDDPNFATGAYYIGVKGYGNTTYTIVAILADDSCLRLVDGQPQQASLRVREWECFDLDVSAEATALTITSTPFFGDPDIYVTTDGSRPSTTNWHFKASTTGADELTVPIGSPAKPHACADCTYRIGVYAYTASNFTLQATASRNGTDGTRGQRVLTDSVPMTVSLLAERPAYFTYYVSDASADVQVRFMRMSGSARLYAAFDAPHPSADAHQWAVLADALSGETAFTIAAANERRCSATPCVLYLAAETEGAATVSLLVFGQALELVALIDGRPQQDALLQGEVRYYAVRVPANATSLALTLTPISGDPDLVVSNVEGERPTMLRHVWASTWMGADALRIASTDARWCAGGCTFTVGVIASTASNYSIVASTGFAALPPAIALQEGTPQQAQIVESGGYAYFRFSVDERESSVVVVVTPLSGDPDLYASFNLTRPEARSADTFSSLTIGGDTLRISHYDRRFCPGGDAAPCELYIGVHAFSGNSSFTILATQANETAIALLDGVPQQASLEVHDWQYYTFGVSDLPAHVRIAVTPSNGDPDIYIGRSSFPTELDYEWRSSLAGGDTVQIAPDDAGWCVRCTYRIGVRAFRATNFSIVATTGAQPALLEDGVPRAASVAAGVYDYYRVLVEDVATDLHLVLTTIGGNADIFVSHLHERPNASHHEFASTALERDAVSVPHFHPAMVACTGGAERCTWYASVLGVNASTYTLSARLSIATSGLRVDAPAEAEGGVVFSNAVFGPPLPFDGESRPLALVEPADGCAELTGGGLTDKLALIDRGGCLFADKVRHAQAKGAAGVLVVNNLDGPPTRMGAINSTSAQDLHIPAVMLSKADGERLRGLLRAGTEVRLTLQQPGDRPLLLVGGMPQRASVEVSQMLYFQMHLGADAAEADVVFTVTADFGDPDIYVSTDGLPPTQSHYDAIASRFGADSLTIGARNEAHCVECVYYIGVYGWSASNFTIVATTSTGVTTLQLGVPAAGRLSAGERAAYRVFVDDASDALRVTLTPLTGDADLFVSTSTQHPDAASFTWASTSAGDDLLYISASDPRFGTGVYFVGVVAVSNSSYTLSAVTSGELRLFHGRPQRASLPALEWQYFVLSVPFGATAFTLTVTPSFGDPDLYLSVDERPTLEAHTWSATASGGDTLTLREDDAHWCAPPCAYRAGVFAWAATNFSAVAVVEHGGGNSSEDCAASAMELEDGVVVYAVAHVNGRKCFRLQVDEPGVAVSVALTPFAGEATVTAGFGPASASPAELRGVVRAVSTSVGSSLLLTPECDSSAVAGACTLHLSVSSPSDCAFSLAATQGGAARAISLVPGRPQYGSLRAGEWAYYSFVTSVDPLVSSVRPALTLSLAPIFGDPNMYIRADEQVPTASSYTWASAAAGGDHLLIGTDDARACGSEAECRFTIGVRAASESNFSLTAYTHGETITVQEGMPLTAVAPARGCVELSMRASGSPSELVVALTALSGEPSLYVNSAPHPSASAHLPGGVMRFHANGGELRLPLGPARADLYYMNVCAGASGLPSRIVLSARMHADSPPLLADGKPFATSIADRRLAEFIVIVGPHATRMQVTASPRSGDLALLLSPRGTGHDAPGAGGSALSAAAWRSSVPGVNSLLARASDPAWCNSCEYAVGVLGQPAANFTLLVTLERAYTLRDGEPQTAQLLHYGGPSVERAAYFSYSVDEPVGFALIVTVYMGSPEVFVSSTDPRPSAVSFQWQPSSASGAGGIRQLVLAPSDANFCSSCTYYVGVVADGNASVAVTASSTRTRTLSLVNGLPLKQATVGGEYLYYSVELDSEAGGLTVSVQSEVGDRNLDIYVTSDGSQPSSDVHAWVSTARLDGEDQVAIRPSDAGYCAGCTYHVAVRSGGASTFTIIATTSSGTALLPLGLPSQHSVAAGATGYFKAVLDPLGEVATLTIVPTRAPLHVMLSCATSQPSDGHAAASLDAPTGTPTVFVLDKARLRQWCGAGGSGAQANGMCQLYIAVRSAAAEDAVFSVSVAQGSAGVLIPGLPLLTHADPARPALVSLSSDAASDLTLSVSLSGAAEAGEAGASVELLVSTVGFMPADEDVGWRAHADASGGGSASVFLGRGDKACSECTYYITLLASANVELSVVASNERGHTLLTEGSVVHSSVGKDEYALFQAYPDRNSKQPLVITVTPCLGNPDLFVSDVVLRPGLPSSYTLASMQREQVERLSLTPAALSKLGETLYISVHGQTAATFTIAVSRALDEQPPLFVHDGALTLTETAPGKATLSWTAAHAAANGTAANADYTVELAEANASGRPLALFTACGLSESAKTVAKRGQRDADKAGRITVKLGLLKLGMDYQVNVRATLPGSAPLLYQPVAFSTLDASGQLGGGAIAAIVLGLLLSCVLASLALAILRRRKQLASLSLLSDDEAVGMHQLAAQLEPVGPLVASPLYFGQPRDEGAAPLAPYAPNYAHGGGFGDALAASLDALNSSPLAGPALGREVFLPPAEIEPAPAESHQLSAAMDSDDDEPESGDDDESPRPTLMESGAGRSYE